MFASLPATVGSTMNTAKQPTMAAQGQNMRINCEHLEQLDPNAKVTLHRAVQCPQGYEVIFNAAQNSLGQISFYPDAAKASPAPLVLTVAQAAYWIREWSFYTPAAFFVEAAQ